jgi:hypothetical protein
VQANQVIRRELEGRSVCLDLRDDEVIIEAGLGHLDNVIHGKAALHLLRQGRKGEEKKTQRQGEKNARSLHGWVTHPFSCLAG